MRGFLRSLVGFTKKPKQTPVDQAFDNIVKGKLDDVAQKVTNFYQHPPPCPQCGAKFDGWEQREGHFFFGGCRRMNLGETAKRIRAEVNKLSPQEKERYLRLAQSIMAAEKEEPLTADRVEAQMKASAEFNKPERKLGEMAYELRDIETRLRMHPHVFGEPTRSIELNVAMIEVHKAIIACNNARSWASTEWTKAYRPEEYARYEAYKKECSDASCNAKHPDSVDPAVLSAIDQTP